MIKPEIKQIVNAILAEPVPPKFDLEDLGRAAQLLFLVAMAIRAYRLEGSLVEENAKAAIFASDLAVVVTDFMGSDVNIEWPHIIDDAKDGFR